MSDIERIKNQFFSEYNNTFISNKINESDKYKTFQTQNNVFNSFINMVYTNEIYISREKIEDILIYLNKMTILQHNNVQLDKNNVNVSTLDKNNVQLNNVSTDNSISLDKNNVQLNNVSTDNSISLNNVQLNNVSTDNSISLDIDNVLIDTSISLEKKSILIDNVLIDNNVNMTFIKTPIVIENDKASIIKKSMYTQTEPDLGKIQIFSDDNSIEDEYRYKYIVGEKYNKLYYFEFHNMFLNINKDNNIIELIENGSKVNIFVAIGNYKLDVLLLLLERQFNDKSKNKESKYKFTYNSNNNRVIISNNFNFNIKFIDSSQCNVQLRQILGFSKIDYQNNNSYTSDSDNNINIYDNIYITSCNLNKYKTSNKFEYFFKLNYNNTDTFNKIVKINLNLDINVNEFDIEFYIYFNGIFSKVKYPKFNFLLK